MKIFIGPWVGEFGWEIIWSALIRKKIKEYPHSEIYISTFRGNEALYEDYADQFLYHDYNGGLRCGWSMHTYAKYKPDIQPYLDKIQAEYSFDLILTPWDLMSVSFSDRPMTNDVEYRIPTSKKINKRYDILIHARNRENEKTDSTKSLDMIQSRNLPLSTWDDVVSELIKQGYSVGAIGTQAHCPLGCEDLRDIPLSKLTRIIKNSKCVISPTSGALHYAMYCGAPVIGWYDGETTPHTNARYNHVWNYFNSKQVYMGDLGFQPNSDDLLLWINNNLEKIKNPRKDKWLFLFNIYDRFEMMVKCLSSFFSSKLPEYSEVYLMDDYSTDVRVPFYLNELIQKYSSHKLKIFYQKRQKKVKDYTVMLNENFQIYKSKYKDFDYMCNMDSDAIYNYDWLDALYDMENEVEDGQTPTIISPYDGDISRTHGFCQKYKNYHTKERTGCVWLIFPCKHFHHWVDFKFDLNKAGDPGEDLIFKYLKKIKGVSYSCYPSKVDHIGNVSLLGHNYRIDRGIDFQPDWCSNQNCEPTIERINQITNYNKPIQTQPISPIPDKTSIPTTPRPNIIQKTKPYLFCGPWVGEFGWELIWSGYCRRIAKQYKNVVVSTFPDSLGLYSDFATSYIFHSFHGNSLINQMDGVSLENLKEYISKITKDNPNIRVLNPYTEHPFFDQHQKYNLNVNAKEVGDFPKYTLPFHGKIDVLVHARNRKDSTMANWPKEKWDELCFFLQSKGLTIGAIGTQAHCPKYCQDLRFLPLLKVMSHLQNTKLLIGPSSGAMHLGSLCGAKLLTWGFSPEEEPHALPRYKTNWNFHNTFVEYISGYKFNPPVERVTEVLRGILKI